jgi:hypothetical protein
MGGQGIDRREALRFIGMASAAAAFPGFSQWVFACSHPSHELSLAGMAAVPTPYKALFFSPEQFRLIEHIAGMIIPADDTPGAAEAGVAEFIDFMVANRVPVNARSEIRSTDDAIRQGQAAQVRFISGIEWINAHSESEFGHLFMDSSAEQQKSLLEELAYKAKFKPTTEPGREFFQMMRDYTVVGYYTSKIGLQSLGYPGLRTAWPKMPGCTHPDDPEHARLTKPGEAAATAFKIAN